MSCTETVERMGGWLNTVAQKFVRDGYVDRDDLIQEATVAILESGAEDEALAATVAVRAMNRYRNRHGINRFANGKYTIGRSDYDDLHKLSVSAEPDGVFWDNLSASMTSLQLRTLRLWAEEGRSVAEIAVIDGVTAVAVKERLKIALQKVRKKWLRRH